MDKNNRAAWRLYGRILRYARTLTRDRDLASDAASHSICAALEHQDEPTWQYCAATCKHYVIQYWRDRIRRNEHYTPPLDDDGEPIEQAFGATAANQEAILVATECVRAFEELPAGAKAAMELAAQEYSVNEISDALGVRKERIIKRLAQGRRLLRARDVYWVGRKRGHAQFVGVFKRRHRWEAVIRKGEEVRYLGYFGSASEAAKAYDEAAKEMHGEFARLNFPETEAAE